MRVLVDGHNLIGRMPNISLSDPDDEAQLVSRLRKYAARTGRRLTVVFDAGLPGGPSRQLSGGGVEVIFAPTGRPADPIIVQRIRQARDPGAWLVVSSDQDILKAAAQRRVRTQRSEEFATQLGLTQSLEVSPEGDPRQDSLSEAEVEAWLREFGRPEEG